MKVERTLAAPPLTSDPAESDAEDDAERARLRMLARGVLGAATPEQSQSAADDLGLRVQALAMRAPGAQTLALIRSLLEDPKLVEQVGTDQQPLRTTLTSALVGMGYPWALEVQPEDLEFLSASTVGDASRGLVLRVLTFLVASGALAWSGFFGAMLLAERGHLSFTPMVIPFAIGVAHSLAAMWTAVRASTRRRRQARRVFGALAAMALVGPIASLMVAVDSPHLFGVGMLFALPSMLTALLCGLTAGRLLPRRDAED